VPPVLVGPGQMSHPCLLHVPMCLLRFPHHTKVCHQPTTCIACIHGLHSKCAFMACISRAEGACQQPKCWQQVTPSAGVRGNASKTQRCMLPARLLHPMPILGRLLLIIHKPLQGGLDQGASSQKPPAPLQCRHRPVCAHAIHAGSLYVHRLGTSGTHVDVFSWKVM
jgi:hypothetical protein